LHIGETAFPGGSVAAEERDAFAALRKSKKVVLSPYDIRPNEEEAKSVVSLPVFALVPYLH
jgi:hypothetical protein